MNKSNREILDIVRSHLRFLGVCVGALIWFIAGQSCAANGSTIEPKYKIAIIDTGYNIHAAGTKLKLCKTGHHDFKTRRDVVAYTIDHGTIVASIIAERLKGVDYCAVIFQVQDKDEDYPLDNIVNALQRASKLGVAAVNYSFDGQRTSVLERDSIKALVNQGASVYVAAGNDSKNLDYECDTFPSCHNITGMHAVGALDPTTNRIASYSNRGSRIKLWYSGRYQTQVRTHDGTSFAAPRALSEYVLSLDRLPTPTNTKLLSVKQPTPTTNTQTSTTTFEN